MFDLNILGKYYQIKYCLKTKSPKLEEAGGSVIMDFEFWPEVMV